MKNRIVTKEEDWRELFYRAQSGEEAAREQLIKENVGLVHMVLKRFAGRGYEMEDLFQIGTLGLMKAVDKFDVNLGYSFSTYAVPVIIGEVKRFLRDDGLIHVSRKLKEDKHRITLASEQIRNREHREPRLEELEHSTGIKREDIIFAIEAGYEVESLSKPVENGWGKNEGDPVELQDRIADERYTQEYFLDVILLKQVLDKLEKAEQRLIKYRYFLGRTQSETAEKLHMNQVAVSRMEKKILQKLRLYLEER